MHHNVSYSIEHPLISFWELPLILPSAWSSATRLAYSGFRPLKPSIRVFIRSVRQIV
ncbi:hypothetical protein H1P_6190002 [Hyella patelloides LEGE 07179]|uniref:Uncharacterized protein n=1 Tax=Hyella patelloides LEGE 07179 TaxID=945734 RepID=A0A563W1B6_9CYAN|nr:hypothetical protein H1P_6190002 [Hyella patelloides LEGE 07179]